MYGILTMQFTSWNTYSQLNCMFYVVKFLFWIFCCIFSIPLFWGQVFIITKQLSHPYLQKSPSTNFAINNRTLKLVRQSPIITKCFLYLSLLLGSLSMISISPITIDFVWFRPLVLLELRRNFIKRRGRPHSARDSWCNLVILL